VGGSGRGEEKLVVFAAVEGEFQRVCLSKSHRVQWNRAGIDLSDEAGACADMREVGREAVAEVDASGGERPQAQPLRDARLGKELGQAGNGFA
jgi:hypothetical protein